MNIKFLQLIAFAAGILLTGCVIAPPAKLKPTEAQIQAADCGSYPSDYKEIVKRYIQRNYFDPYSIQNFEVPLKPFKDYYEGTYGYMIAFQCNAKNKFGAYTGIKSHVLFVRNGEVIALPF